MVSRAEPARLGAQLFPQAASFPELQLLAGPRGHDTEWRVPGAAETKDNSFCGCPTEAAETAAAAAVNKSCG